MKARMIFYSLLLIGLLSCRYTGKQIDKEFYPYLNNMFFDTKSFTPEDLKYSTIKFHNLPEFESGAYIGMCFPLVNIIFIDPKHWYIATKEERTLLLRHELEHCININLFHKKRRFLSDWCPASAFEANIPSLYCAIEHYQYYMNEMDKFN